MKAQMISLDIPPEPGTTGFLYRKNWDKMHMATYESYYGDGDVMEGVPVQFWRVHDVDFLTRSEDEYLTPGLDEMPTHYIEITE
jgi:hypothetical protein